MNECVVLECRMLDKIECPQQSLPQNLDDIGKIPI